MKFVMQEKGCLTSRYGRGKLCLGRIRIACSADVLLFLDNEFDDNVRVSVASLTNKYVWECMACYCCTNGNLYAFIVFDHGCFA